MSDERDRAAAVVSPPKTLPGRPDAVRTKPKSGHGGAGRRRRWRGKDGTIYEWDYQHGAVEVYDSHGRQQGEIDPVTGNQTKPPVAGRRIEP